MSRIHLSIIRGIVLVAFTPFLLSCTTNTIPVLDEGARPNITSKFDNEKGILHGVNVKEMANGAPLRAVAMAHTNLSPDEAWEASIEVANWSAGAITDVDLFRGSSGGNRIAYTELKRGDVRHCLNKATGDLIVEKFRYVNHDQRLFVFSLDFERTNIFFPAKNHTGVITVESDGNGGSILTMRGYFDTTWNPVSWIFMPAAFRSAFDDAVSEFAKVYSGEVIRSKLYQ